MEREVSKVNNRHLDSKLYRRLLEFTPEGFDFRLDEMIKVARSCRPSQILDMMDVLATFVYDESNPSVNEKIMDTLLDRFFGVLEDRNVKDVKELLSGEYYGIVNNLESIKDKSDSTMVCKIEELYEKEFFPSHKIDLDS